MSCRRCHNPDSGTTDLCLTCEALFEHEQNLDDDLEQPWAEGYCFLRQFASTPCQGRIDPAHLIAKSRLKREHVPKEAWWDPRIIVPACRSHHAAFDTARSLRVPRSALPEGVEGFAATYGLEWALDLEFGRKELAA